MAFSINSVRKLLDAALLEVAGDIPVQTENTKISPGIDPWMRSTLLPATSEVVAFGAGAVVKMQGIYQIDLFYPSGVGLDPVSEMAEAIEAAFFPGASITDGTQVINIDNISQFAASVDANLNYCVPIRVQWFSYVTNA
jgi:hypothetical protein